MPRFRLQTALNVRERVEKLKQKELALQLQIAQDIKQQLQMVESSIEQSTTQLQQAKATGFTIIQLQFHEQYQKRLKSQWKDLRQQFHEQQQVVDEKQQELLRATQKRKVLEILKEKTNERYLKHQRRLERNEMDEISQNIYRAIQKNR